MKANELLRRLRKLARNQGVEMTEESGKGSHLKVKLGDRRTIVPLHGSDLKKGTLAGILKDLGIEEKDL